VADNSGQFVKNDPRRGTKPKGSQHHRTKFLAGLEASSTSEEEFISKIVEMAREGNSTCLGIAASRLWRESKPTFDVFELPESESPEETINHITQAMTTGQVSPDWAASAMQVLRAGAELTEIKELLQIVKKLEEF
jgi:hypothetical protein